jgi:hypothetical protein
MIWLASYPRSGNTLLRLMLNRVFGIRTASAYPGEIRFFEKTPGLTEKIGHYEISGPAAADMIIKTHGPPPDDAPALYVARNGRSAIVSYFHFTNDVLGAPASLESVIRGDIWAGSWSEHVRQWSPQIRANTVLLRYEDLVNDPARVCAKVSSFLRKDPIAEYDLDFDELRTLDPQFFRSGSDEQNIKEIIPYMDLFDSLHGDIMKSLGYS